MKKIVLFLVLLLFGWHSCANADILNKSDVLRVNDIGMKILMSNNIDKRLIFGFTNIAHQGCCPIFTDSSLYTDYNLHNNRIVSIFFPDYLKTTSDDEVAALLAHNIAQGVNSYNGVMHGQLFWTKEVLYGKANELKYDKQAVDYLVKAGYNPVAIITIYDKVCAEWRGVFWGRHEKASKRMNVVYDKILLDYPKYLTDNEFTKSNNYKRFVKTVKK